MELRVGLPALRGDIQKYAQRFDLLELVGERGKLPRSKRLREWVEAVPKEFCFTLVAPREIASLEGECAEAYAYLESVASVLSPRWLLLRTPASVRPGTESVKRVTACLERLKGIEAQAHVAWEASGLWEDAAALAAELGVHWVQDLSRDVRAPTDTRIAYTRLRALGAATRLSHGMVERLAEQLLGLEEVYAVVECDGAGRARAWLTEELEALGAFEGEEPPADEEPA